ncbi:WD40/YVTN/BNR-like repeat-containing protein [Pseudoalteromonas fenneropenaei]|uniref:WD40/YVTN/BNR-like repeat-containing protein n=1 Tax=Pseudoalteromonas fenneropenaei TaxID=1737459 RepID=A0ABV7CHE8_9GAMM
MMYKLSASLMLLFFGVSSSLAVSAQTTAAEPGANAPQESLHVAHPERTLFTDVTFNGERFVAVGKHGTIIYSSDGAKWQQANVPLQSLLTSVYFIDQKLGWACGHDASILVTEDGGENWVIQHYSSKIEKPCLDIAFVDAKHGVAIGAYGMYYETSDGGRNWQSRFVDDFLNPDDKAYLDEIKESDPEAYRSEGEFMLPHLNRITTLGERFFIVGEMGLVAESQDGGKSWQRLPEFYNGSFFDVSVANNQMTVAGLRGNAFQIPLAQLEDGNWQQLNIDKPMTINSILTLQDHQILVGNSGVLFTIKGQQVTTTTMKNGKSILAAVAKGDKLIMATESGMQTVENNN